MGKAAVPLLLAELQREPDDWFWALHAITGAELVPEQSRGKIHEMADAWLTWGRQHGYGRKLTSRIDFPESSGIRS